MKLNKRLNKLLENLFTQKLIIKIQKRENDKRFKIDIRSERRDLAYGAILNASKTITIIREKITIFLKSPTENFNSCDSFTEQKELPYLAIFLKKNKNSVTAKIMNERKEILYTFNLEADRIINPIMIAVRKFVNG